MRFQALAFLAGVALLAAIAPAPARAEFIKNNLTADGQIVSVALKDLDRDGRVDPILASRKTEATGARTRKLRIYALTDGEPEIRKDLDVPNDVVAFTAGDFLQEGASQILYLTRNAAITFSLKDGSIRKIIENEPFIFDNPIPDELPHWDYARDLNDDGRDDLILADPAGFNVWLQQAGGGMKRAGRVEPEFFFQTEGRESGYAEFSPSSERARVDDNRDRGSGQTQPDGGPPPAVVRGVGLRVNEPPIETYRALNRVVVCGANADKLPDLLALNRDTLMVYVQKAGAGFGDKPDLKFPLGPQGMKYAWDSERPPVAHADVDGDGDTDFVISEVDPKELTTKLRVYLWGASGPPAEPDQLLKVNGLGDAAELVDANADGALDIGLLTLRADKMLELAKASSEELEATYYLFLYDKAKKSFSRSPDLKEEFTISVAGDSAGERARDFTHLQGDYNGDGVKDLLIFDNRGALKVKLGKGGAGYSVGGVAFTQEVKAPRSIETMDLDGDKKSDLILRRGERLEILRAR